MTELLNINISIDNINMIIEELLILSKDENNVYNLCITKNPEVYKEDEKDINTRFNECHEKYFKLLDESLINYTEEYPKDKKLREECEIREYELHNLEKQLALLAIACNFPNYKINNKSYTDLDGFHESYNNDTIFICIIPLRGNIKIKCDIFFNREEARKFSEQQQCLHYTNKENPFLTASVNCCELIV
jgi:hypothetical protein